MKILLVTFMSLMALGTQATQVNQCKDENFPDIQKNTIIGTCNKPPCRLRKNTKVYITYAFKASPDVKKLVNKVSAVILGIDFPFVGVDGSDACRNVYEADGVTKNHCKFDSDKTYLYKDVLDVLQIYPRVKTVVHWALTNPDTGKNVFCMQVPSRITN